MLCKFMLPSKSFKVASLKKNIQSEEKGTVILNRYLVYKLNFQNFPKGYIGEKYKPFRIRMHNHRFNVN